MKISKNRFIDAPKNLITYIKITHIVPNFLKKNLFQPKRYTRSISDEINEQLLNEIRSGGANFFVNELSSKSDERYN